MSFRDFASDVACFRIMFPMLSGPHAFFVFSDWRHLVISSSDSFRWFVSDFI